MPGAPRAAADRRRGRHPAARSRATSRSASASRRRAGPAARSPCSRSAAARRRRSTATPPSRRRPTTNPEKIPGALATSASSAYHDPLGTGKALIGYDELAAGRYEDWFGQMGIGALGGGAGTVPSRASRLNRVVGSPRIQPLGRVARSTGTGSPAAGSTSHARLRRATGLELAEGRPRDARSSSRETIRTACASPAPATRSSRRTPSSAWRSTGWREPSDDFDSANPRRSASPRPRRATRGTTSRTGGRWSSCRAKLHEAVRHTGGVAALGRHQLGAVTPGGVFTPFEQTFGRPAAARGAAARWPGGRRKAAP